MRIYRLPKKDKVSELDKKWNELKTQKEGVFADYAAKNKVVRQLIDLGTVAELVLLKGEALNNFVKRSIDLIKISPFKFAFNICKGIVILHESQYPFLFIFTNYKVIFSVEYGILETIVYIWGNEHLSYSESHSYEKSFIVFVVSSMYLYFTSSESGACIEWRWSKRHDSYWHYPGFGRE